MYDAFLTGIQVAIYDFLVPTSTSDSSFTLQSTFVISNMRYVEHFAISNKSPGPFSTYGQAPYKFARYLELRYLEPFFLGP